MTAGFAITIMACSLHGGGVSFMWKWPLPLFTQCRLVLIDGLVTMANLLCCLLRRLLTRLPLQYMYGTTYLLVVRAALDWELCSV